jgi:translation elongation factor EF-1alpha
MALVRIDLVRAVCVEKYADYRALGRITLRDQGATLAVGIVTETDADLPSS